MDPIRYESLRTAIGFPQGSSWPTSQIYRRNRPSASGLDPEGEGRTLHWDPVAERLRFEVPRLPDEVAKREDLAARVTPELTGLGQTVIDVLGDAYLDWDDGGREGVAWIEQTFGGETSSEER